MFQLSFDVGEEISILQRANDEWWWAELNGSYGYIPVNYVVSQSDPLVQSVFWQDAEYYDSYGKLVCTLELMKSKMFYALPFYLISNCVLLKTVFKS